MKLYRYFAAALFCCSFALHLCAGVKVTTRSYEVVEINCFQDGKAATWSNDAMVSLWDAKDKTVTLLDPNEKVFSRIALLEIPGATKAMIDERMEMLTSSPFFQMMMEQQRSEHAKHSFSNRSIGKKNIADIEAEGFQILRDAEVIQELWVSPVLTKLIEKDFPITEFEAVFQGVQDEALKLMGADPTIEQQRNILSRGVLVYERESDMWGNDDVSTELIAVESGKLPAHWFTMPKGYREIPYLEMILMDEEDEEEDGEDW
jgi:hypothetical protein